MSDPKDHPHTTINIHAPVFGHVAGRDIYGATPPPAEPERAPPPPPLETLAALLRQRRLELRRYRLALVVNWPCALLVLACLSLGGHVMWTILSGGLLQGGLMPFPALVASALCVFGLGAWLQAFRRPLFHVIADLRAEVRELERAVALRKVGRW